TQTFPRPQPQDTLRSSPFAPRTGGPRVSAAPFSRRAPPPVRGANGDYRDITGRFVTYLAKLPTRRIDHDTPRSIEPAPALAPRPWPERRPSASPFGHGHAATRASRPGVPGDH